MKKFFLIPISILTFVLSSCDSTKSTTNNYYDDGIYHEPNQSRPVANTSGNAPSNSSDQFSLGSIEDPEQTITTNPNANPELYGNTDYYDPNDQYYNNNNGAGTVVNNYYNTPSYRMYTPNTGLYWNSWGGWGASVGFGYGWGYGSYCGYYDPFFYDPWYNPWYRPIGYGYGFGWNRPYWNGGWGYNSYWAGFYNGYYYGSNDAVVGRGRTYTGYTPIASRTNSYNSRNLSNRGRKSTIGSTSGRSSTPATGRRGKTSTRSADSRLATVDGRRTTTPSLSPRTVNTSRTAGRTSATDRSVTSSTVTRGNTYSKNTYDYVRGRTVGETSIRNSNRNVRVPSNSTTDRSRTTEGRSNATPSRTVTPNTNSRTQSRSKDEYFNQNRSNPNTNSRTKTPSRSSGDDMYVPSQQRNRSYEQRSNQNNNRGNYTPPATPNRSYDRTPSRSSTPSRSYTPSRSSSPSRSSTPSYTPSRSSSPSYGGGSRSSGGSSRGSGRSSGGRR